MLKYSDIIPEKLARKLLDNGFHLFNYKCGTYDGKPSFDIPGPDEPGWADGNRYRIPTYGEVFDQFSSKRGIVITLEPFFTYSLKGHIAYTWKISYQSDEGKLESITEEDTYTSGAFGGSFCLTANDAIEFAIGLGNKNKL